MISLKVIISTQELLVYKDDKVIKKYPVSTAKKGAGEMIGSEQTPRGWHVVRAKIGKKLPINTVFVERRLTGEIYTPELGKSCPERDWILTRIMWLSGLEKEKNRLGAVDTMRRYIYLHGTAYETAIGTPRSKGCICLKNQDIIELFDYIPIKTRLLIQE